MKTIKIISIMSLVYLVVETRTPNLRDDNVKPKRDYRPSKWISNSALDIWYGNKTMVDVLSREFTDIINRIAMRPARETKSGKSQIVINTGTNIYEANKATAVNNVTLV